jgi:hypothetical protein
MSPLDYLIAPTINCDQSPHGGKSIHALCSHMSPLDYLMALTINCPESDVNDEALVYGTRAIGGCDGMEEYLARGMYPLSADFGFGRVNEALTSVLSILVPLSDLMGRTILSLLPIFRWRLRTSVGAIVRESTKPQTNFQWWPPQPRLRES